MGGVTLFRGRAGILGVTLGALATAPASEIDSCFEFFLLLPEGISGHCADVSFFGSTGDFFDDASCASGTLGMSTRVEGLDMFPIAPLSFFSPKDAFYASVELTTTGAPGALTEFAIEHRGDVSMHPFSTVPDPGAGADRWVSFGSESEVVFQAIKQGPPGMVPVEIQLRQDFVLTDPPANNSEGETGSFFLMNLSNDDTGDLIDELIGSTSFDSAVDGTVDFADPFAPAYVGFATATEQAPGVQLVDFSRLQSVMLETGMSYKLDTVQSGHIMTDGAVDITDSAVWRANFGNTFVFTVSSPDPAVRFAISFEPSAEVVLPALDLAKAEDSQVTLSWQAIDTQNYTILFSEDLSMPKSEWQTMGAVSGTAGLVERDFSFGVAGGFFVLRVEASP